MSIKKFGVPEYINWYFDVAVAWIGLVTVSILLIILIKKLSCSNNEMAKTLKFWIYSLYCSNLFFMIAMCCQVSLLPMLKALNISNDQQLTCNIISNLIRISGPWYHISIFNVFMERIYQLCIGSIFEVSKCRFMIIRIIHCIIWLITTILAAIIADIDRSPYNVYTSSNDINSAQTCSIFTSSKIDLHTNILLMCTVAVILISNIFAWCLFMNKFAKIIKYTNNKSSINDKKNDDFYRVMREQTLIVALAVSSTLILFIIQITGFLGQSFFILDFVLTPIIIFLGLKCNRYYFKVLKCDRLAVFCCSKFENRIIAQLSEETTPLTPNTPWTGNTHKSPYSISCAPNTLRVHSSTEDNVEMSNKLGNQSFEPQLQSAASGPYAIKDK